MRFVSRKIIALLPVCFLLWFATAIFAQTPGVNQANPDLRAIEIEQKINRLLSQMTLAEKLGQLQQLDGEANGNYRPEHLELARKGLLGSTLNVRGARLTNELQRAALEARLKIPILFGFDVIHGYRTIFPMPLAEAASWDLRAMEQSAAIAAAETRAAGVHWTFAPMVDIARDPRWGRVMEGAGEDVFLGSAIARARVLGFQGADIAANNRVLACAKHFAAYGAAEAGRDYNTTDVSERALRETYLPTFKAAIDAGVGSFMTAFNDLNGIPATANAWLLRDTLRRDWKFDGLVVSDYTAVMELVKHGLAANDREAAMYALNAGTDMEMVSRLYNKHGAELVANREVTPAVIDQAVRHVLRVKFRLGLFDKPFADEDLERATIFKKEYQQAARETAAKSFVLLKNERETLPISQNVGEIAVVGALAAPKAQMLGALSADGRADDATTILENIRRKVGSNAKVRFAKGCELKCESDQDFKAAVDAARAADFTVLVAGETKDLSAEAASRTSLDLPGKQLDLIKAVHQTGKPYAVVLLNGRPLTINWLAENSPAILEAWFPGTMGGAAIADVLFGDANPSCKLPITFPRNVGQIPIYYSAKATGRPFSATEKYTSKYLDAPNTPLFSFGFGLSYTNFQISDLQIGKKQLRADENLTVSVTLENTGKRLGAEVVQLYVRDVAASVTRPVKQLRGFERVELQPGRKRPVNFVLKPEHFGFLNREMQFQVEPGMFQIFVGNSSEGGLSGEFEVIK